MINGINGNILFIAPRKVPVAKFSFGGITGLTEVKIMKILAVDCNDKLD